MGELRKKLISVKSTRRPRSSGADRRGQIPDMVSIQVRPPEIEDRLTPGHWEGDLIKGKANASEEANLGERTCDYLMLVKMNDATTSSSVKDFSPELNSIALAVRKSMTYDQGRETTRHAEITQRTSAAIYFCDPNSPRQRGSNENINRLIRQYLPAHSKEELDAMVLRLNMRPRKHFDFKCPIEEMSEVMQDTMIIRHDPPPSIQ